MRSTYVRLLCLLLQPCSCVITSSRPLLLRTHVSRLCSTYFTCICIWCMHSVGVCACVSHNSATVGHRVQPSCSLSVHSVHRCTNLIHFALTLNSLSISLSLPLQFRVSTSDIKLHFCCARAVASVFCVTTQTELILEIAILARSLAPVP